MRSQFLVEVQAAQTPVADLDELNGLFTAWVERVYHRRVHRETGQTPLERFMADGVPDVPGPALLREAFLWSEVRTVTKTATISLAGNRYETDPALVGRRVEAIFDPFDLTQVEVRWNGVSFGLAAAHQIGAHVHPKAVGSLTHHDDMPASTGIDYLALVAAEHRDATRRSINFADLPAGQPDQPDQPELPAPWPHEPPLPLPDAATCDQAQEATA